MYVSNFTNTRIPAVLRGEQLAWFVKPKVLVKMTLIVPQSLHVIQLVLHDVHIAGICQILHIFPQASKDSRVVIEITGFHESFGFGVPVVGEPLLWKFVIMSMQQSHRIPQSLRAKSTLELLIHVKAEDIAEVVTNVRFYDFRYHFHAHHRDVLPPGILLHLNDFQVSFGIEHDVWYLLWQVCEHVICHW